MAVYRDGVVTAFRAVIGALLNSATVFLVTWQTTDETKPLIIATATVFVSTLATRGAIEGWWDAKAEQRRTERVEKAIEEGKLP